jgi:hypothetical protein
MFELSELLFSVAKLREVAQIGDKKKKGSTVIWSRLKNCRTVFLSSNFVWCSALKKYSVQIASFVELFACLSKAEKYSVQIASLVKLFACLSKAWGRI